ncbi:MAG: glycosyltransferase family 2 protein [Pacificibacter sp.]|uniref:glycosyltransferase family 2 protein n=1 Tax=Pacificibacter sp. TaxID=1917866 RepID=UPI00321B867D
MPKISIILPVFNAERFLESTLETVLSQTFQDWELIAVDDGSTDRSAQILERAASTQSRIRVFCHPLRQGAFAARNTGIDHAKGAYIAFLDADDLWHPTKLAAQLSFMSRTGHAFCCTDFEVMDAQENTIGQRFAKPRVDKQQLLLCNTIGTSTVMISRALMQKHRFPALALRQDYALWLNILSHHPECTGLNAALARYRRHPASLSASIWRSALATWAVYKEVPNITWARSIWSYANYVVRTAIKRC